MRPSAAADVYALAGSLWTCVTGRWPLDYAAVGIDPKVLGPEGLRCAIATGVVPLDSNEPWAALQRGLGQVLKAEAGDRPTAAELGDVLGVIPC